MKKTYLLALVAGCTLCMLGCSNQVKDKANDPDTPAVTEETGITEGAADVAGQDTGEGTIDSGNSEDPAGDGIKDSVDDGAEDSATAETQDSAEEDRNDTAGTGTTTKKDEVASGVTNVSATKKPATSKQNNKNKKVNQKSTDTDKEEIGMEAAKKIALAKAGLTEQDGSWKEEKRDREDGLLVYELEFVSGNKEYEFEINAHNGIILEYQQDTIDD